MNTGWLRVSTTLENLLCKAKSGISSLYACLPKLPQPTWLCVEQEGEKVRFVRSIGSVQQLQSQVGELAAYRNDSVALLLEPGSCFYQELNLSVTDPDAIEQLLPFQLEHILPFPADEAVWSFTLCQLSSNSARLFVSCTREQQLQRVERRLDQVGLLLDLAVSPASALLAAHRSRGPAGPCLYGLLSEKGEERQLLLTFFLVDPTGVRGVRDTHLEQLDRALLTQELRKSLLYLQAPASCDRCLIGSLESREELIELFDTPSTRSMSLEERTFFMLRGLCQVVHKGARYESFPRRKGVRWWHKCAPAMRRLQLALVALTASTLLLCSGNLARVRGDLKQASLQLVGHAQQAGIELEPTNQPNKGWIEACQTQLSQRLNPYPLTPDLPSLRDTLTWINQLLSQEAGVQLVSFEYITESAPTPKYPLAHYRVKVELELEIHDLTVADSIQQRLSQATHWIERPHSLVWKAQKDRYRVTFYLKDRTHYGQ